MDRLASFRTTYVAIVASVVLWALSVQGLQRALESHFRAGVAEAVRVQPGDQPVAPRIREGVQRAVRDSVWTRWGGVQVTATVVGADGRPLYLLPPPGTTDSGAAEREYLLPATADVVVAVPIYSLAASALLVLYFAFTFSVLYGQSRRLARQEAERLAAAVTARDGAAERAERIEHELEEVRRRIAESAPRDQPAGEEIRRLRAERAALRDKLSGLARREEELLAKATRSVELDEERHALEELLEESLRDINHKDEEIQALNRRLKSAAREASPTARSRENESVARRLRTLYKNLEIDDRAIQDLVGLRDGAMQLKAEEAIKRLSDEAENAAVRRKVGGLPPGLPIFELGFAGKGRVYYTHGTQRRFRLLTIGAKNTQKTDLEYLSRIARSG